MDTHLCRRILYQASQEPKIIFVEYLLWMSFLVDKEILKISNSIIPVG